MTITSNKNRESVADRQPCLSSNPCPLREAHHYNLVTEGRCKLYYRIRPNCMIGTLITGILTILGGLGGETIVYAQEEVPERKVVLIEVITTEQSIEEKIRNTFPEDSDVAVAIAKAESELNTNALNPEPHKDKNGNVLCHGSIGIMQIACVHVDDPQTLHDVDINLQTARKIYDKRGWEAWGAYTDGRYKKYLD